MSNKHAKESKLNVTKIIFIIIIIIAIVAAIMYFTKRSDTQNTTANNIEETNIENTENTENSSVESSGTSSEKTTENDGVGEIVPPSPDDPIVIPEENRTDNENKAVELAKKFRGEDDSVYYTVDSQDGDIYNIIARSKETTAAIMFYSVNVATEEVKEQ